jgi:hypothetical protein
MVRGLLLKALYFVMSTTNLSTNTISILEMTENETHFNNNKSHIYFKNYFNLFKEKVHQLFQNLCEKFCLNASNNLNNQIISSFEIDLSENK